MRSGRECIQKQAASCSRNAVGLGLFEPALLTCSRGAKASFRFPFRVSPLFHPNAEELREEGGHKNREPSKPCFPNHRPAEIEETNGEGDEKNPRESFKVDEALVVNSVRVIQISFFMDACFWATSERFERAEFSCSVFLGPVQIPQEPQTDKKEEEEEEGQ